MSKLFRCKSIRYKSLLCLFVSLRNSAEPLPIWSVLCISFALLFKSSPCCAFAVLCLAKPSLCSAVLPRLRFAHHSQLIYASPLLCLTTQSRCNTNHFSTQPLHIIPNYSTLCSAFPLLFWAVQNIPMPLLTRLSHR